MTTPAPTFPPLLRGEKLPGDADPMTSACAGAKSGELGAGDILWSPNTSRMRFALVLEPDVPRTRCGEMVYAAMVAFGDSAGALIPPEIAITYQWPNAIQMNDGQIGFADLEVSETENDGIPDWMVLVIEIQMVPSFEDTNPGENYHVTTMWDEGCGDITRTELLESTSRHIVNAIHNWSEDGFAPVHEQWLGRINKSEKLSRDLEAESSDFIGLDEVGDGLLKVGGETRSYSMLEALAQARVRRAEPT